MTKKARKSEPSHALSGAEWEVMKVIWDTGPLAARDVYSALPNETNWAYKTVKTLLSRLVAKGALEYDQIGNSYLYRAAVAREQMTRQEMRGLFSRVMGAALSPVLLHFIEEAELSDDDLAELQQLLDAKRSEADSNAKTRKKR